MCGENRLGLRVAVALIGSPPRVRGKLLEAVAEHREMRITPACAGKTSSLNCRNVSGQDHPRVCGENLILAQFVPACPGSPPRVRGKRENQPLRLHEAGITPACAGKTADPTSSHTSL